VQECLAALQAASLNGTLAPDHAAFCDEQTEVFERLLDAIENDSSLSVAGIEEYVRQAALIRDSLTMMRGHSTGGSDPRDASPLAEIDEALAALNLVREPGLDWITIDRRGKALRKKHNTDDPDHCKTPEMLWENTERMKAINNAMDTLKKYRDRLADLMAS
jgi:hypothetical protein